MSAKTFLAGFALFAYYTSYVSADNTLKSFAARSTECPAGQFGTATTACAPCLPGSFSPTRGSPSCTPASIGSYVSGSGSSRQTPCDPGSYNLAQGSTSCFPCMAGSYGPSPGGSSCQLADIGYYVSLPGSASQKKCSGGTFSSQRGSIACTGCPPGSYCSNQGQNQNTPTLCPPGTYSTGGQSSCSPCGLGTFNQIAGSTTCCPCCANFYANGPGNSACSPCDSDKYSDPGSHSPGACKRSPQNFKVTGSCTQTAPNVCPMSVPFATGITPRDAIKRPKCWPGQKVCPVYGYTFGGSRAAYDCVDVQTDLESCGGCVDQSRGGEPSEDGGRDCSAIPHVGSVRCLRGRCIIDSCRRGFVTSADGDHCVSLDTPLLQQAGLYKL